MELRDRRQGFGFPGYDGSLPKAIRSSRGRGEVQCKANNPAINGGYCELLATVAGQLLQEEEMDRQGEKIKSRQNIAMEQNDKMCQLGDSQSGLALLEKQRWLLHDKYVGADCKSCKCEVVKDLSIAQGNLNCKSLVTKVLQNSEDQIPLLFPEGAVGSWHDMNLQGPNELTPVVQTEMVLGQLEHGFFDMPVHAEDKEESDTNHNIFRCWIKREEGSCMGARKSSILADENPPLASSGSSEEVLNREKIKSCIDHPFDGKLGNSKKLARTKARDDDDNYSGSFIPERIRKRTSRTSFIKAIQARTLRKGNIGSTTLVTGTKRKYFELDGTCERGSDLCGYGTARTRQRIPRWLETKIKNLQGSICGTPKLHVNMDNLDSLGFSKVDGRHPIALLQNGKAASVTSSPTSVHVSITSFMVPELFVDLPETATVSNLKKAVMEAAMNLLGGGLHVRVLFQGEKVPDENATLAQAGISHPERKNSLGFLLEPNRIPNPPANAEDPLLVLSHAASEPAARYPTYVDVDANERSTKSINVQSSGLLETEATESADTQGQGDTVDHSNGDLESFPRLPHGSLVPASRALILHAGLKEEETKAILRMAQKHQVIQGGKRRIRRPFTVAEVEALVQAVEVLGTGRWRDVKLQAFEQAKHRTYVDLKDKWKTLVHTARIAAHQRRGEPVPQQLLDRVIQAHNYWTAQQAKQHADLSL